MRTKKWEILTALAVGCAAGWLLSSASGCAFLWMAAARADDVVTETKTCPASPPEVTFVLADAEPVTLASVLVVAKYAKPHSDGTTGYASTPGNVVGNKIVRPCDPGDVLTLVTRQ